MQFFKNLKNRKENTEHIKLNNQIMQKKDGFYQLDKDQEALDAFLVEIRKNSLVFSDINQRFKYLIDNGYYEDFYQYYTEVQIESLWEIVTTVGMNFKFATYTSAYKFYTTYALKTNDKSKYLESYEDRILAVALALAKGRYEYAKELAVEMIEGRYQPATPTFLNAGKKRRGEFVSCFLLEIQDSLNSITFNVSTAMQLSKIGGGVALNLSNLRSHGESIKGIENVCKGIVPVMKLLENGFSYADQMGQRKGAGAVYLNIFHYEIEEFLDTKKVNADEKSRIQTLSMGIVVPNKFFELARDNKPFFVFAPYSLYKATGKQFNEIDFDKEYDDLIVNESIVKKELSSRELLTKIAKTQFESGYPYIIFSTNANNEHALGNIGKVKMSNLCTEIFQLQTPSVINDYEENDELGYDISCVLGSLNIVNVVNKDLEKTVDIAVKALTAVSRQANIKNAPSVKKANNDFCSIGLGVMNLHGFFMKNNIDYESEEAKDFCNIFFMLLNYYTLKSSMSMAKRLKKTFKGFENTDYADGSYFALYTLLNEFPKTEKVTEIFKDMFIPTKEDWIKLKDEVIEYGLYHAYRLAIAPTQTISYLHGATMSVMPISEHIETRTFGNSITYYPMPYLTKENQKQYKTAYETDMYKMIDLIATIQQHVDQGISTLLYVTNRQTTRDLVRLYAYANLKGLKSLYYTRNKNLTIEEGCSCAT